VQLKKDFLRQLFRGRMIAQEMPSDAIDHRFMLLNRIGKGRQGYFATGDCCVIWKTR
jgi:hypothetical protein